MEQFNPEDWLVEDAFRRKASSHPPRLLACLVFKTPVMRFQRLQLAEQSKDVAYDEHLSTCINYSVEWKLRRTVKNY